MDIEKILNLGVTKEIINEEQKISLMDLFNQDETELKQVSGVVKVFYYIGGIIMLCAMIFLMSHTIQNSTYTMILVLGTVYAVIFGLIGEFLWRKNEKLPAGILYFLVIATFGFIVLDIEKMTGFFPHFADMDKYPNYWDMCRLPVIVISVLTIEANTFLQKHRQVSLLALPTIVCSYAIYLTIVDSIYGCQNITEKIFYWSSIIFGIGLNIVAFIKDRLTKVDYSKWMYAVGAVVTLWAICLLLYEPTTYYNDTYYNEIITNKIQAKIFLVNLIYLYIGLLIQRKVFSIIGILGVIEYILYMELSRIQDHTTLLTCVVLITGLIILCAGVLYNKNADKVEAFLEKMLPSKIRKYLPQNRV